jgi:large subunit ribosomal protein L25
MKKAQLSGSLRANVGKKDAKALRDAGRVPCVLYGPGEQTHFSVRQVDLDKIVFSPDVYHVELDIEGVKKMAIIQDKHMHPVKDKPLHIDFLETTTTKEVRLALPLRTTGAAIGVMNGGKLRQPYRKLKVLGLPHELPEEILVDITKMRIGSQVRISDLAAANKMQFLDPANAVVLSVKTARGAVDVGGADEEEEETAEAAIESTEETASEE